MGWFLKVVQLLARAKLALTITSLIGCLGSWSYRQRRKVRSFEERILNRFGALSFDAAKENNKLILKFITSSLIYYGRADLRGGENLVRLLTIHRGSSVSAHNGELVGRGRRQAGERRSEMRSRVHGVSRNANETIASLDARPLGKPRAHLSEGCEKW